MQDEQITGSNATSNAARSEMGNLSIKDLFYKYIRFLPLILLSLAISLLAAWVYLRYATRIYGSMGTLLIKNEQSKNTNDKVESIIAGGNRIQNIQSEMEVLRSKPLMERVVNKLQLQLSYTAIGKIVEQNVYKRSPFVVNIVSLADSSASFGFTIRFVNANQFRVGTDPATYSFGQPFKTPNGIFNLVPTNITPSAGSEYKVGWMPAPVVAGIYAAGIQVQPKTVGTTILNISTQATNPELAADIINHLMVEYDSLTVEQNNYSTDQMLAFINDRLRLLNREIDSIQLILLAYQQKYNLIDVESQSGNYFNKISELDKTINEQQLKLDVIRMIDAYLRDKKNEFSKVPSSLGLEDPTLNELISTYNSTQLERQAKLDANTPPQHPTIKVLEGQIEKIRENLLENLKNINLAYSSTINNLKRRNSLEEESYKALPYKLKEYVEIQRQVNTKTALYSLLEGKREEAAISRAATRSNSQIIDLAFASDTPVKPNKRTIQIIAILAGIGLPALLIFLSEVLNDKITTRFDIEKITGAPVIGEVGHSFSEGTLLVNKTNRSMVAEQFRIIRSNLQYILPKNEKPVIMVTSSVSGEGKSFISTNMGAVMALTGKKTVILEFDIRKPKVMSGLKLGKKPGMSNYLLGKAELQDLIVPVPDHENLFVLPCGPIPPNPSELLLDEKVDEMFDWLKENFDVIVIDTAPVGMVSDAMTLGKYAVATLYLARQGHTFKKQIILIDEFYQQKKLPRVSIILNDVKIKPGYGYYGYGRYGYGYGYGYGYKKGDRGYYEEEKPPTSKLERVLSKLNPRNWFK
jgi:tyrosine-protein kinase Etk/Wzc